MRPRALVLALPLLCAAPFAALAQAWPNAQGWVSLDHMILSTLTRSGTSLSAFWFPDHGDPAQATRGLGIAYEHIPGSASGFDIALGYYVRTAAGWAMAGPVQSVYGQSPRDPAWTPTTLEITTTMLGPNEPRCCPSVPVRWRIDLGSLAVQRLN
jgi:hypothetical protein